MKLCCLQENGAIRDFPIKLLQSVSVGQAEHVCDRTRQCRGILVFLRDHFSLGYNLFSLMENFIENYLTLIWEPEVKMSQLTYLGSP